MSDFGRLMELALAAGVQVTPPNVVELPAVSPATATVGDTLNCTPGMWSHEPTGYAYSWQHVGSATDIGGGLGSDATYRTDVRDGDTSVHCVVTATNSAGTGSATSNAVLVARRIGPARPAPPRPRPSVNESEREEET